MKLETNVTWGKCYWHTKYTHLLDGAVLMSIFFKHLPLYWWWPPFVATCILIILYVDVSWIRGVCQTSRHHNPLFMDQPHLFGDYLQLPLCLGIKHLSPSCLAINFIPCTAWGLTSYLPPNIRGLNNHLSPTYDLACVFG